MKFIPGHLKLYIILKKLNFLKCLFTSERERQSMTGGGADTRTHARTHRTKQALGSRAVSTEPYTGLELTNCEILTWAEFGCLTNWGAPKTCFLIVYRSMINFYVLIFVLKCLLNLLNILIKCRFILHTWPYYLQRETLFVSFQSLYVFFLAYCFR